MAFFPNNVFPNNYQSSKNILVWGPGYSLPWIVIQVLTHGKEAVPNSAPQISSTLPSSFSVSC